MQVRDALGAEPAAIADVADLGGARILEVGCGEGRLTRFAARHAREIGIRIEGVHRERRLRRAHAIDGRVQQAIDQGLFDLERESRYAVTDEYDDGAGFVAVTREWAGTNVSDELAARVGRQQGRVRLHQDVRLRLLRAR